MLYSLNALDLYVLIFVPKAEKKNQAFSIAPEHLMVDSWNRKLKKPILEALESMDFLEQGVFRWGFTGETEKLVILITVDDETNFRCDEIRTSILSICSANRVHNLDVVIEEGQTFAGLHGEDDEGRKMGRQPYLEKVPMGHSIGMEKTDAGNVGGYLVLINPKNHQEQEIVSMINWHVLRPSDPQLPAGQYNLHKM